VRTLKIEETVADVFARERANVVAPEDTIAVVGNDAVSRVAKRAWKPRQQAARETPEGAELAEDEANGVGARTQQFVRLAVVDDHVDRVEIGGIYAVPSEDFSGEVALQRGELKDGAVIAAKNELDEAVAESADTVVQEDGVGHGLRLH
jgi:hypothetical protein